MSERVLMNSYDLSDFGVLETCTTKRLKLVGREKEVECGFQVEVTGEEVLREGRGEGFPSPTPIETGSRLVSLNLPVTVEQGGVGPRLRRVSRLGHHGLDRGSRMDSSLMSGRDGYGWFTRVKRG